MRFKYIYPWVKMAFLDSFGHLHQRFLGHIRIRIFQPREGSEWGWDWYTIYIFIFLGMEHQASYAYISD